MHNVNPGMVTEQSSRELYEWKVQIKNDTAIRCVSRLTEECLFFSFKCPVFVGVFSPFSSCFINE